MFSLVIASVLAVASPSAANQAMHLCTAERLRPFVSPAGLRQSWPQAAELPSHFKDSPELQLSSQGNFEDGYTHWLVVDDASATSYVLQRGGFAGTQIVYGPLPVASCQPVPPNNSFNPMPLRGTG